MPDESFQPPKPPTPFIGRERELDWLRENTRERNYGRPIVITGPAGIGKTALAATYIDKIGPSVVINGEFTVGSDSPLARPRGAEKAPYTRAVPGRGEASGAIWLAARTFSEDRHEFEEFMRSRFEDRFDRDLVVLDGADEESGDSRERAVYRILNFKRVRTLIVTSRNDLELRGERTLRLESLPQDEAQKLVKSLAELDSGSIGKILDLAGGRPLLLNMMGDACAIHEFRGSAKGVVGRSLQAPERCVPL